MSLKNTVKAYFTFTRRDRTGILVLLFLILFIYFLPYFSSPSKEPALQPVAAPVQEAMANLKQEQPNNYSQQEEMSPTAYTFERSQNPGFTKGALFSFDPNTLSHAGWQKLGLREKTIKTILNYRTKGGRFYRAEDLKKIWGLPSGFYERVAAFIHIEQAEKKFTDRPAIEKMKPAETVVAINTADTSAFIRLPGIGSKLAQRIVHFREKLGGFYSVEQIGETYGLPDSTFQKIKRLLQTDANQVRKININTATKEELKNHPYIKWTVANALVEYRNQHGAYAGPEDVKKVALIDEHTLARLLPYLSF